MTQLDDYQKHAHTFSQNTIPATIGAMLRVHYPLHGLVGEVGELSEVVKRAMRDGNGQIEEGDVEEMTYEMGDILWYLSEIATVIGVSLENIAGRNLEKLAGRQRRHTINGKGHGR